MPRNISELKSGGGVDNSYAVPHAGKWGGGRAPVPHRSTPVVGDSYVPDERRLLRTKRVGVSGRRDYACASTRTLIR